jgi:hypothetical protein
LQAIEVWIDVMRDEEAPASARCRQPTGSWKRILGRLGEKLSVQKKERHDVTVRLDVERLEEIVRELKALGAIDGESRTGRLAGKTRGPHLAGQEILSRYARMERECCAAALRGPGRGSTHERSPAVDHEQDREQEHN